MRTVFLRPRRGRTALWLARGADRNTERTSVSVVLARPWQAALKETDDNPSFLYDQVVEWTRNDVPQDTCVAWMVPPKQGLE